MSGFVATIGGSEAGVSGLPRVQPAASSNSRRPARDVHQRVLLSDKTIRSWNDRADSSVDRIPKAVQTASGSAPARLNAQISAGDFRTLNRCVDDAIAGAVTLQNKKPRANPMPSIMVSRKRYDPHTNVSSLTASAPRHSSQCLKATDPTATTGTAKNMPATPASSAPVSTATITANGCNWMPRRMRRG